MTTSSPLLTHVSLCAGCGLPLGGDGILDVSRLAETIREHSLDQSRREDLAQIEARIGKAQIELATAKRLKDSPAQIVATRQIEALEERREHVAAHIGDAPRISVPFDGGCRECGTPFRGGRVDRAALDELVQERSRRRALPTALQGELRALHVTIENERRAAEECEERAQATRHPVSERQKAIAPRERLEHSVARIVQIENEIARGGWELQSA